uniref:DUF4057 domain-containing protein n=1 Tax=Rhizophora mucronata TaxID=61149 RepID=A0A2P2QLP9_RHIMU
MEKSTAVRKPHTSTADILTWTEAPLSQPPPAATSAHRSLQPSDKIGKVVFGGQVTDEEAEALLKKKACSGNKWKEMTGSGIFGSNSEDNASESDVAIPNNKTGLRIYQQAVNGISQISFNAEEKISPKKPTSLPEVAKQRELSGTMQSESETKIKRQISDAKFKEISGHDIFAPPTKITPRSLAAARSMEAKDNKDIGEPAPRNIRTSVKVSNPAGGQSNILFSEEEPVVKMTKKMHDHKFQELTGNNIFKGDVPSVSAEKPLSTAKQREMSGSDIFADGKAESKGRDYFGGVRKPPGGESSITLV